MKFRAKNIATNEWWYASFTDLNNMSAFILSLESKLLDIKTLGRYSGRCDKNNKEIYEGDNIKAKLNGSFTGTVVYDRASFKIDCPNGRDINNRPYQLLENWCNVNYKTVEILGNIHEESK